MTEPHTISPVNARRIPHPTSVLAALAALAVSGCSSSGGDAAKNAGSDTGTLGTTAGTPSSVTTTSTHGSASASTTTTTATDASNNGATATTDGTGIDGTVTGPSGSGGTGSGTTTVAATMTTTTTATTSATATATATAAGAGGAGATASSSATGSGGSGGSGGTASVTCPETVIQSGDSTQRVQVEALDRSYYLHIPTGYTGSEPLPLVIDFHPLGGTGMQQANSNGWKAKADSVGFIVAYPDSYNSNNSWNVGMCCMDAQQNRIDDVGFTKAMIDHISSLACVDPKRIYATGCSNGGGMTYKVACDLADTIAGAAPVDFRCVYGGTTNAPSCEGCMPSRPISITHFDNTGDNTLVPYNGGLTSFPADCPPGQACTGMGFPSAADNFATWQQINECSGSASTLDNHTECQTNDACGGGVQVTMCVQQGGSHCGNYSSLGIVDTAWEMFERQSL